MSTIFNIFGIYAPVKKGEVTTEFYEMLQDCLDKNKSKESIILLDCNEDFETNRYLGALGQEGKQPVTTMELP
jgi:hypothetical protein